MAKARQENRAIDLTTASPPISAAMQDVGEITPYEVSWRRMTILLRISMMHADTGLVLMEMEEMRDRCAEEAREAYERAFGTQPMAKLKAYPQQQQAVPKVNANLLVAKGRPLTRSTTKQ